MSADFENVSRTTHARQYAYCLSQRDHCCGPFAVLYGDCDCTGYISVKSVIITKYWSLSNTKHSGRISVNSSKVCFTFHRLIHSSFPSVGRGRSVDNISFAMTDRSASTFSLILQRDMRAKMLSRICCLSFHRFSLRLPEITWCTTVQHGNGKFISLLILIEIPNSVSSGGF